MSLWGQIREALGAFWGDVQRPDVDGRIPRVASLTEAWSAEQRVSAHLRLTIPDVLYEPMRRSLADMASADVHHGSLLREHFAGVGGLSADGSQGLTGADRAFPCGPWLRLRHILAEKRELYECYHQEASRVDDPRSQALLRDLRDAEERHQEQLITMLTHLDAHIHETIA